MILDGRKNNWVEIKAARSSTHSTWTGTYLASELEGKVSKRYAYGGQ